MPKKPPCGYAITTDKRSDYYYGCFPLSDVGLKLAEKEIEKLKKNIPDKLIVRVV